MEGLQRRIIAAEVRAEGGGRKTVSAVINTADIDSHLSIVEPAGCDLARFVKNPVLLWAHGDDQVRGTVPVGRVVDIDASDEQIAVQVEFDEADAFAANIARQYRDGFLKGFSIGFIPRRFEYIGNPYDQDDRHEILDIMEWELVELSCVSVPSNPMALAE